MTPVDPGCGYRLDDRVKRAHLPQVLENLSVLVVLNAVADGLQTNPRSRLGGGDGAWGIDEDAVAGSAEATAASGGIDIVPTADGVSVGPAVGAVIEDAGGALGPVQEAGLDAVVD